jgi:signal transduction histidine kinase
MTALRLMADAVRQAVRDGDKTRAGEALDTLDRYAAAAADDLRRTVARLHPVVLEQQGLVQALGALAESIEEEHGVDTTFRRPNEPWPADPTRDAEVVHIVRETASLAVAHCVPPIELTATVTETMGVVALVADLAPGDGVEAPLRLLSRVACTRAARIRATARLGDPAGGRISLTIDVPFDGAAR